MEYNPVKDATDTQIALEKAISHGSSQIWLLGATDETGPYAWEYPIP